MKAFFKFFAFTFITLVFLVNVVPIHAQSTCVLGKDGYCPLTALPGISKDATTPVNVNTYIPAVIKLIIGIAGALAVIRIMMGGIKYMTSDAFESKSDAKETINMALIGLLLAISAYIILYTLNPNLVTFKFDIAGLRVGAPISTGLGGTPSSGGGIIGPSYGKTWETDSIDRTNLTNLGITINHFNCSKIGDTGCTSVLNMSQTVINGLEILKKSCASCVVRITGGTEYWLHGNGSTEIDQNPTAHKPGGNVVDLSLDSALRNFLKTKGTKATGTDCTVGDERYKFGGGLYVNEVISGNDPHWHVCF